MSARSLSRSAASPSCDTSSAIDSPNCCAITLIGVYEADSNRCAHIRPIVLFPTEGGPHRTNMGADFAIALVDLLIFAPHMTAPPRPFTVQPLRFARFPTDRSQTRFRARALSCGPWLIELRDDSADR